MTGKDSICLPLGPVAQGVILFSLCEVVGEMMAAGPWQRSVRSLSGHAEWPASRGSLDLLECPGKILGFGPSQVWV